MLHFHVRASTLTTLIIDHLKSISDFLYPIHSGTLNIGALNMHQPQGSPGPLCDRLFIDVPSIIITVRVGPLTGGPECRMSILRNSNVACLCRLFMAMSHVEFKKYQCRMSLSFKALSHVDMLHVAFRI